MVCIIYTKVKKELIARFVKIKTSRKKNWVNVWECRKRNRRTSERRAELAPAIPSEEEEGKAKYHD